MGESSYVNFKEKLINLQDLGYIRRV